MNVNVKSLYQVDTLITENLFTDTNSTVLILQKISTLHYFSFKLQSMNMFHSKVLRSIEECSVDSHLFFFLPITICVDSSLCVLRRVHVAQYPYVTYDMYIKKEHLLMNPDRNNSTFTVFYEQSCKITVKLSIDHNLV